jgi:hypothetical protein
MSGSLLYYFEERAALLDCLKLIVHVAMSAGNIAKVLTEKFIIKSHLE